MLPSSGESSAESATVFWVVVGWWWPPWIWAWTNDRFAHRSHSACPNDFLVSCLHNSLAWGVALTPITPNTPTKSYCRCLLTYVCVFGSQEIYIYIVLLLSLQILQFQGSHVFQGKRLSTNSRIKSCCFPKVGRHIPETLVEPLYAIMGD